MTVGCQTEVPEDMSDGEKVQGTYREFEARGQHDIGCQASSTVIAKEVFFAQHESAHHADSQERVSQHKNSYPGGTLPTQLCSFVVFVR